MALTEAQKKAVAKYNAKSYDRLELKVRKGKKNVIKDFADRAGESVNNYAKKAIQAKIKADFGEDVDL